MRAGMDVLSGSAGSVWLKACAEEGEAEVYKADSEDMVESGGIQCGRKLGWTELLGGGVKEYLDVRGMALVDKSRSLPRGAPGRYTTRTVWYCITWI